MGTSCHILNEHDYYIVVIGYKRGQQYSIFLKKLLLMRFFGLKAMNFHTFLLWFQISWFDFGRPLLPKLTFFF